jgi:signal transduction histidine kinase
MDEGTAPNITRVHDASERASEARFQALASASGGAVYRVSADWSEIRELESSHSRSDGAVPSGAWEGHHIPPDERARIATELRQAIGATRPFELEHRVIREHGALGWSRSRVVPVLGGAGELLEWIAVVTDVTTQRGDADERARLLEDRTLALAAADREHRRLLAVLEQLPIGIHVAEAPSGRLVLDNAADRAIRGVAPGSRRSPEYGVDYMGHYPPGHPHAGDRFVSDALPLSRVLATGVPVGEELVEFRRGDGSRRLAGISAVPVRDAEGHVVGVVATTVDMTEREQLRADERTARVRAERLQALTAALAVASTTDAVAEEVVRHVSVAFDAVGAVLSRLSPDGESLEMLCALDMPRDVGASWQRIPVDVSAPLTDVVRTRAPVYLESRAAWKAQYPHLMSTLEATDHEANAVLPLVVDGRVIGVLGAAFAAPRSFGVEDRAEALAIAQQCAQALERARLFEAERMARDEAEAASRAKGDFLAVMSHELRTPLNAIGGYAELLEMGIRGPVTPQQREDLQRVQASQRHLLGLVNEVLNYVKLGTGTVHYDMAIVNARDALASAEALVAPQARSRGLTLTALACPEDLAVCADAEKLRQILINLLSNAIKFTPRGGQVELSCSEIGDRVHMVVRDTGIGIAQSQLARIFDPFVQVRSDLTRTADGTGLGLAISRDLARGMSGDLTLESEPGVGSVFTLVLPRG